MEASAKRIAVHTIPLVPAAKRPHEELYEEGPTGSSGCDSQRWLDVVDEIQRSEEAFRDGLAVIEEVFRQPLQSAYLADQVPSLEHCFKGLREVEGVSDALLAVLRQPRDPGMIPDLHLIRELVQRLPFLGLFVTFVASYPAYAMRIANLRQTSAKLRITLAACEASPRAAKMSLETWLLTVVQRVPRWCLLLRRLQTCCDLPSARQMVEIVDRVASRLDCQLDDQQGVLEVLEIQRSVTGLSGSLLKPGRRLLRHGTCGPRSVWLFNDLLMICLGADNDMVALDVFADLEDVTVTRHGRALLVHTPVVSRLLETGEQTNDWAEAIRCAQDIFLTGQFTLHTGVEHTMRRRRRRSLYAATTSHSSRPSSSNSATSLLIDVFAAPIWMPDSSSTRCLQCHAEFSVWRRRHHCRLCGIVCCHRCSQRSFLVEVSHSPAVPTKPSRACDACYEMVFGVGRLEVSAPSPQLSHVYPMAEEEVETPLTEPIYSLSGAAASDMLRRILSRQPILRDDA